MGDTKGEAGIDWRRIWPGFWVSLGLTGLFMLLHLIVPAVPSYPQLLADALFASVPMFAFEFFISLLGTAAKPLAFFGCILLTMGAGTVLNAWWGPSKDQQSSHDWIGPGRRLAAIVLAVTLLVVYPAAGSGWFGLAAGSPWITVVAAVAGALMYGAAASFWTVRQTGPLPEEREGEPVISRRRLLAMGSGWLVSAAAFFVFDRWVNRVRLNRVRRSGGAENPTASVSAPRRPGYPQMITPQSDFYQVSKNLSAPSVSLENWSLTLDGHVNRPYTLVYDELRGLPAVEQIATLICVSNPVGGELISNARWTGVRLADLLNEAGVREGAIDVVFHAVDGYSDSIPLGKAMASETLLTYAMNSETLTPEHGFPARMIVPGIYGMKHVKWIERIEVVDYDYKGYWQERNWSDTAVVKTMSRIDQPLNGRVLEQSPVKLAGIAFAGTRTIDQVQLRIEGSGEEEGWRQTKLEPAVSPYAWRFWTYEWNPPSVGRYRFTVRAVAFDEAGNGPYPQVEKRTGTLPDGASGYHSLQANVV